MKYYLSRISSEPHYLQRVSIHTCKHVGWCSTPPFIRFLVYVGHVSRHIEKGLHPEREALRHLQVYQAVVAIRVRNEYTVQTHYQQNGHLKIVRALSSAKVQRRKTLLLRYSELSGRK